MTEKVKSGTEKPASVRQKVDSKAAKPATVSNQVLSAAKPYGRSGRACAAALEDGFQCFHDRCHTTFAGLVQQIVGLEVALPVRGVQVATIQ